ncbi:AAA family ATPase [Nocardiopsis mangrovi]|uniref:AAA family ATPase n=1 Tax=Nocardiopsis mangrovi TaxID=1179818 RepID=A0ABV9DXT4_9ACTN
MPTRKELSRQSLYTGATILARHPKGMHIKKLWYEVTRDLPSLTEEWAIHVNDKLGPERHFRWRSAELVKIGWLRKDGNGIWYLTGPGYWSLTAYPEMGEWFDRGTKRYAFLYRRSAQVEQATKVLALMPEAAWVKDDDLAEAVELPTDFIVQHLYGTRPEGWYRVLDGTGAPSRHAHLTNEERAQLEGLLEQEGILGPDGRGLPANRITSDDLTDYLADAVPTDDEEEDDSQRRAWLVRGSNVHGENLVRSFWLPSGMCSLDAARLPEMEPGAPRGAVGAAVAAGYDHLGPLERGRITREFHAFLSRMRVGDIVLTNDGTSVYIGVVDGPAAFTASSGGRANMQRRVRWHNPAAPLDYVDDLPPEAANRLANPDAALIDLTEFAGDLERLLGDEPEQPVTARSFELPDADARLADKVHFEVDWLQECVELLRDRPQLIFHGPPGTGKTYVAQALADHLTGGKPENVQLVQFHPAYSYEDFFEGFRPRRSDATGGVGFELTPGPLRKLADAARKRLDERFVLIIDEINRGNLAKIFGELYFLLEYRDRSVELLYRSESGISFTLPKNLVLLATMNTADRSIALMDAAMRRRFWFVALRPSASVDGSVLQRWLENGGFPDDAARLLTELNTRIGDPEFEIGHSYLMREALYEKDAKGLERVWQHQILPLLEEHHYGDGTDAAERYGLASLRAHLGLVAPSEADEAAQ